jgi:uncharacterized membrane protein HdeD (DUF308 family)
MLTPAYLRRLIVGAAGVAAIVLGVLVLTASSAPNADVVTWLGWAAIALGIGDLAIAAVV